MLYHETNMSPDDFIFMPVKRVVYDAIRSQAKATHLSTTAYLELFFISQNQPLKPDESDPRD